jgi:hypothetical protein
MQAGNTVEYSTVLKLARISVNDSARAETCAGGNHYYSVTGIKGP